jgi:hypothetical protein
MNLLNFSIYVCCCNFAMYVAEILLCMLLKFMFFKALGNGGRGNKWWEYSMGNHSIIFVQIFLDKLVIEGTKTYTDFKKVHLNSCAKVVNEHFKINRTGDQIFKHLKTLKKVH